MADQNPLDDDPKTGTTDEADFGRTDRYENKDEPGFNVRNVDDDTASDSGGDASLGRGTHSERDVRSRDADTAAVAPEE